MATGSTSAIFSTQARPVGVFVKSVRHFPYLPCSFLDTGLNRKIRERITDSLFADLLHEFDVGRGDGLEATLHLAYTRFVFVGEDRAESVHLGEVTGSRLSAKLSVIN